MRFESRSCDICNRTSESARRGSSDISDRQHYRRVFEGWKVIDEDGQIKDVCPSCVFERECEEASA